MLLEFLTKSLPKPYGLCVDACTCIERVLVYQLEDTYRKMGLEIVLDSENEYKDRYGAKRTKNVWTKSLIPN